jgi:hypothetical protein
MPRFLLFEMRVLLTVLPVLMSELDLLDFCLSSSCDYRSKPLCLALISFLQHSNPLFELIFGGGVLGIEPKSSCMLNIHTLSLSCTPATWLALLSGLKPHLYSLRLRLQITDLQDNFGPCLILSSQCLKIS